MKETEYKLNIGFVLLTVLWLLAIISIVASIFAKWTYESIENAKKNRDNMQNLIDLHSTQAVVLYLLSTQQRNIAGITTYQKKPENLNLNDQFDIGSFNLNTTGTEVRVDDRAYKGKGSIYFSLQDKAGLYNLNIASFDESELARRPIRRILANFTIPLESRNGLLDKLQDYIDDDDNHRINGAEKYHYKKKSLPPPANRRLFHPMEVYNIMDWDNQKYLWQNNLWGQLTTISFSGALNINTAPLFILKSFEGIDTEIAQKIITSRNKSPFSSMDSLSALIGINMADILNGTSVGFYPSRFIRISLWYQGGNFVRQIHIKITPTSNKKQPWYIAYTNDIPMTEKYKQNTVSPLHIPHL